MTDFLPQERIEELVSQAEQFDPETLYSAVTILSQDIDRELESRRAPSGSTFHQIYDTVSNEERIIEGVRSPEFHPVGEADVPEGIAEDIAGGRREFESLLSDAVDESDIEDAVEHGEVSERIKEVGEKLLRRFAAACRTEICTDRQDLFQASSTLDRQSLAALLTPIITGALAGALTMSLFAPLAVLVALFVVDVGLEVYCSPESESSDTAEGEGDSTAINE